MPEVQDTSSASGFANLPESVSVAPATKPPSAASTLEKDALVRLLATCPRSAVMPGVPAPMENGYRASGIT